MPLIGKNVMDQLKRNIMIFFLKEIKMVITPHFTITQNFDTRRNRISMLFMLFNRKKWYVPTFYIENCL